MRIMAKASPQHDGGEGIGDGDDIVRGDDDVSFLSACVFLFLDAVADVYENVMMHKNC